MEILRMGRLAEMRSKERALARKRLVEGIVRSGIVITMVPALLLLAGSHMPKLVAPAQAQTTARPSSSGAQAAQSAQGERPQMTTAPSGGGGVEHTIKAFQDQVAPPAPVEKPPVVEFASAVRPGEHPGPGELVRTIRTFVHWTLVCDALTGKRQVCFLEQQVRASDGVSLTWQVAQTADGHVMMILKVPAGITEAAGIKLSFGGFERTERGLRCDASSCVSVTPFEGRVAEWMTSEANVGFGFEANGHAYQFTMSMEGFKQAVDAIPRAPVKTASRVPEQAATPKVRAPARRMAKGSERLMPLSATGIRKDFDGSRVGE